MPSQTPPNSHLTVLLSAILFTKAVIYKKILFFPFFLLILLGAVTTKGQTSTSTNSLYSQVSIASPTAASLGKFTDVPVSYHTGIPEVSVPLYTIKEGSLALPISLSYHAGGIKVLEPASWVGMGWALNAGGVITRSVMGAPDESGTSNTEYGHFSDFGYSSYLTIGGVRGNSSTMRVAPNDDKFKNNLYDGEPDLFFFNFNGYSGKFYFSDDRTPVVVDGQDLKIECYYPRGGGALASFNIQGFIITVPTGDRYYFGNTADLPTTAVKPVELTYPYSGYSSFVDNNVYSSYYLNKIVAADKVHTITFTYEQEQYSYYTLSTFPVSVQQAISTYYNPAVNQQKEFALVKNNIDGVRLSSIHFSAGQVSFNAASTLRTDLGGFLTGGLDDFPNTKARALDNVTIADDSFCKQFAFTYAYFGGDTTPLSNYLPTTNGGTIETDKTRLKLESVVEKSCDGSIKANPWVFTYNGNFLPRRLSFAQDHWGFYNGATGNTPLGTLIPSYTVSSPSGIPDEVPGANRDTAMPYLTAGMLTQITYPTGGSATFEFEPNDVWVNSTKYEFTNVLSETVNNSFSTYAWNYLTFKPNTYYRFKLDYISTPTCISTGGTSVSFSDNGGNNSVVGGANPNLPHYVQVVKPNPGTRKVELWLSTTCDHQGTLTIDELGQRTTQRNVFAGGLRISKLTLKENATAPGMVTSYAYQEPSGQSSGTLYSRPRYVQIVRNDVLAQYGFMGSDGISHPEAHGCLGPEGVPNNQIYLVSPCSILPMSTTQGSHIGYDIVTVTKPDNGRTEYHYAATTNQGKLYQDVCYRDVVPSVCDPSIPSQPAVPLPYEYDRGQVKYQGEYNAQGQLVKTTSYQHFYDSTRLVTPAYLVRSIAGAMLGNVYERRGYWQTKSVVTETLYGAQAPAHSNTQIQYFASPFHHQLTRSIQTASNGDTLETRSQYAFDVRTPSPDAIGDGFASYQSACASCDAAFQNQLHNCTTDDCRSDAHIDNVICRATARQAYVTYRRQNFTNSQNNFQTRHDAEKSMAGVGLKSILQLQDDGHNPVIETSQWKNRQLLSASHTIFDSGLNQPTVMYPARQYGLFLTTPSPTFTPANVNLNQLQLDSRYAVIPETTLTFDQGALVEVRPKNGIVTSYVWSYNNTLPIVKAVGVRYATLKAAYTSGNGNVTALRGTPALAHALLTTYTHQPLVGMLSQTDPTGRSTTYEYDALGRLIRTRDEQGRILSQQHYHYAGIK